MGYILIALSPSLLAADDTTFQLRILPMECSIDTLSTGANSLTQLSPEDCIDEPPHPPETPHAPVQPPFSPSQPLDHVMSHPPKTGYESVRPLPSQPPPSSSGPPLVETPPTLIGFIQRDFVAPTLLIAFIVALFVSPFVMRAIRRLLRRMSRSR